MRYGANSVAQRIIALLRDGTLLLGIPMIFFLSTFEQDWDTERHATFPLASTNLYIAMMESINMRM